MPRKGFKLPERIVTLFFEDGEYKGFELDMALSAPMGMFWQIAGLADDPPEDPKQIRDLMLLVGGQLRGWNLQDSDGSPVPASPEAFADRLDQKTQLLILAKWAGAVAKPPIPLSRASRNGGMSAARKTSRSRSRARK